MAVRDAAAAERGARTAGSPGAGSPGGAAASVAVRVAVRVRPPLGVERAARRQAVRACPPERLVRVGATKAFAFDDVFGPEAAQDDVYATCVLPLVELCAQGYNATCLAYGQTGSGKTYTMTGDAEHPGVMPRAISDLFAASTTTGDDFKWRFSLVRAKRLRAASKLPRSCLEAASSLL